MRRDNPAQPSGVVIGLEVVGVFGAVVTGWLGGELVDRMGVGVTSNAHLDAPSSLTRQATREG